MTVVIKKTGAASQSYGRGSDAKYAPAKYGVFKNGVQVAFIVGTSKQYFDKGSFWSVNDMRGRELFGTRKGFEFIKQWAVEYFTRVT